MLQKVNETYNQEMTKNLSKTLNVMAINRVNPTTRGVHAQNIVTNLVSK